MVKAASATMLASRPVYPGSCRLDAPPNSAAMGQFPTHALQHRHFPSITSSGGGEQDRVEQRGQAPCQRSSANFNTRDTSCILPEIICDGGRPTWPRLLSRGLADIDTGCQVFNATKGSVVFAMMRHRAQRTACAQSDADAEFAAGTNRVQDGEPGVGGKRGGYCRVSTLMRHLPGGRTLPGRRA
jgi:hypothetical protein